MKQQRIIDAARATLLREGLPGWTMERVAREAECAKGLVHYHFRTKTELLALVAASLRRERAARRTEAFRARGAAALDALWQVLEREVSTGEAAAWLSLAAQPDAAVREALLATGEELDRLGAAAGASLGTTELSEPALRMLMAAIDGLELPLVLGESPDPVREAYDRLWLTALS
jgi:AcrR family transcriptional regulator